MKFFLAALLSLVCCSAWCQQRWSNYYERTIQAKTPRTTLIQAIERFGNEQGIALDLGCGTGRDSLYLLEKNWNVVALDQQEEALLTLKGCVPPEKMALISFEQGEFLRAPFPKEIDLINASYSIPFCEPERFPMLWKKIENHLVIGGRFSGQFFGERDAWASIPTLTHHTREELLELLRIHFEIEYLEEEEWDLPCGTGGKKQWHVFHIIARKVR